MIQLKDPWELQLMRQSGQRLAEVTELLREAVGVGISTIELDLLAERAIRQRGGVPSFKGYRPGGIGVPPFPATICASLNEQVVHGIPNERPLVNGDILSVDVGLIFCGYHSDCAFTVQVGSLDPKEQSLLDATYQSLYKGIALAHPGNRIGDIGFAVQNHVVPLGFGVIREYVGHGIGRRLHEAPSVPNYGKPHRGLLIKPGMCLAIEPMVTQGGEQTFVLDDDWTVVTKDGSCAAHFEHTVAITDGGPEVLTRLT